MTPTWWSPSFPSCLCSNVSLSMRSPRSLAVITKEEQWFPHVPPPLPPFCPFSLHSSLDHLACQVLSLFVYCLSFLTVNLMTAGIDFITLSILYLQYRRHTINALHFGRMTKLHENKETVIFHCNKSVASSKYACEPIYMSAVFSYFNFLMCN